MAKEPQLLIDNFSFKPSRVINEGAEDGRVIVRGEFARANIPTENKRIYPRSLWEREIKRLKKQMEDKKVYGLIDHPADGRTSLAKASHVVTNLWLEGEVVMGEAEVINTAAGRDLKAILDVVGSAGVSSRGFGTTRPNQEGVDVVQDDYRLMTFDFVADPANVTSYPVVQAENKKEDRKSKSSFFEDKKTSPEASMKEKMTLDELKTANPGLYENLRDEAEREFDRRGAEIWAKKITQAKEEASTTLRASFAEQLKAAIESAKAEVAEAEREKLFNDPTVAGAKSALEGLKSLLRPYVMPEDVEAVVSEKDKEIGALKAKIAEHELAIANLTSENAELSSVAKEAGYKYHLERLIKDAPFADLIRKTVGDVKQYANVESLNARVGEIVDEINKVEAQREERDREIERYKKENADLKLAAEKALAAAKQLSVVAYTEERLRNHPRANEIRPLIESTDIDSKDQVDSLLDQFRPKKFDANQIDEARQRVRKLVGSGAVEALIENEELPKKTNSRTKNYNGLGEDAETIKALAGLTEDV